MFKWIVLVISKDLQIHPRISKVVLNHLNIFFSQLVRTILEAKYHFFLLGFEEHMLGRFRQAFEGNMDKTRPYFSSRTEALCIWTQNAHKRGEKFPNMYTSIPAQTTVIWRRSIRQQEKVSKNYTVWLILLLQNINNLNFFSILSWFNIGT